MFVHNNNRIHSVHQSLFVDSKSATTRTVRRGALGYERNHFTALCQKSRHWCLTSSCDDLIITQNELTACDQSQKSLLCSKMSLLWWSPNAVIKLPLFKPNYRKACTCTLWPLVREPSASYVQPASCCFLNMIDYKCMLVMGVGVVFLWLCADVCADVSTTLHGCSEAAHFAYVVS